MRGKEINKKIIFGLETEEKEKDENQGKKNLLYIHKWFSEILRGKYIKIS